MKEFKCMGCGKEAKVERNVKIVICEGCQILMEDCMIPEFCFLKKVLKEIDENEKK